MEVSQLLQRCLRHTLTRTPSCTHAPSTSTQLCTAFSTRRKTSSSASMSSVRLFSSTSRRRQETLSETPGASQRPSRAAPDPKPSDPPSSSPPSRTAPRRTTVDHSSILSMFGKRPNTREPAAAADDDLLSLFGSNRGAKPSDDDYTSSRLRRISEPRPAHTPLDSTDLFQKLMSEPTSDLPSLRLRPALGRSVSLQTGRGVDLTRAFRVLEMRCTQNSVRKDAREQLTYVRRGQRRKIDRMRRWRALFQQGFMEECSRVRRMRAQGW